MPEATLAKPVARKKSHTAAEKPASVDLGSFAPGAAEGMPLFLQRLELGASPTGIEDRLQVNEPGDAFEQEADAVAERVTQAGSNQESAAPVSCRDNCDQQPLQRKPRERASGRTPSSSAESLQSTERGSPLSETIRSRIEPVLGADLGSVRVHTDPADRQTASALNARAFTHKNHIWLGRNESADDTKLLAHEATHVVHQSDGAGRGDSTGHAPAIQRTPGDGPSAGLATPVSASTIDASPLDGSVTLLPEPMSQEPDPGTAASPSPAPDGAGSAEGADGGVSTETGDGAAAAGGPGDAGGAQTVGGAEAGAGGETGAGPEGEGGATRAGGAAVTGEAGGTGAPPVPETGAGALETGDLVLIDVELAEHQRWAGALGRVGEAASINRAEFIAEAVGSGFISGAASGLAMGLGIGLVTRAVPAIGPVIGGALALHGLVTRDWAETGATIGRFGEGSDTYETLANTIASISAVIDVVSQVLTVINGIVGVVQIAAAVIAGGAVVAAFFTFGATLGIAAVAADVVGVCEEITLGINAVTMILDTVNAGILQPCVTLFRALHAFTTQADPREVEAQGRGISTAAAASGAALGAWAGGKAAHIGGGAHPSEDLPPSQRPPHEAPPPAAGEGPVVHFQEPAAPAPHAEAAPLPAPHAEAAPLPAPHAEGAPLPAAHADGGPLPPPHAEAAPPAPHAEGAPPPAAPPAAPEATGSGMRIQTHGDPNGELGRMTDADIDTFLAGIDSGGARSDTFFELPGQNPRTGGGLQGQPRIVDPMTPLQANPQARINPNPNQITYSVNDYFTDVGNVRIANAADVPIGAPRGPGDSVIPAGVGIDSVPPRTTVGAAPPGGNVEVRYHSANPRAPAGSYSRTEPTVQVNTPSPNFGWRGDPNVPVAGATGRYLLPDGRWVGMANPTTPAERAAAHWPVGASGPAPGGPGGGGGAPPPPAGPAPPIVPPAPPPMVPPAHAAPPPGAPQRILVVGAERPEEFQYASQMTAMGNDVTVVNPQATPESAQFAASGGNFVQAGIETLPQRPGFNAVSEDFPVPIRRMFPQAQAMAAERISRLEPGGRWVVTTESAEFVHMLEVVGGMQGARVTSHEVPRFHEATPDSPQHVVEPTRFIVTVDAPNAPATPPVTPQQPTGPPPPGAPTISSTPSVTLRPTAPPTTTAGPPPATTSSALSNLPAAAGAARAAVAQQAPGGPQPGTESPTWGTRAHQVGELFLPQVFGSGGPAPTYAQQQAAHRARFTGDNQPAEGVERVNPDYTPPPATPAQITAIQNEIMNVLAVRASAEQEAQNQSGRADRCEENQSPIRQTVQDTAAGISAVQAHDAAIARREAVNQEQQQRQQESQGLVAGYPSRATGLVALSVPLSAWEGFTSLASHLPGEAGDSMLRMNQEARQLQDSFTQIGAEMLGVDSAGPAREAELQGDQGRLEATDELAQASDQQLNTASDGAAGLQDANEAALAEATQRRDAATERAQECSEAVGEREERADSLAEQLNAWASAHAQARQQAIAETQQRLESEGKTVVRSSGQ